MLRIGINRWGSQVWENPWRKFEIISVIISIWLVALYQEHSARGFKYDDEGQDLAGSISSFSSYAGLLMFIKVGSITRAGAGAGVGEAYTYMYV